MMNGYDVLASHRAGTPSACRQRTPPSSTTRQPAKWTFENIETQKASFKRMGLSYDWDRTVITCERGLLPLGPVDLPQDVREGPRLPQAATRSTGARAARPCSPTSRSSEGACWRCHSVVETQRARPVVLQDHRLRPGAARRPRPARRLARARQADAGQLDRPLRGRATSTSRCATTQRLSPPMTTDHRVHHPRRHAVRLLASSCLRLKARAGREPGRGHRIRGSRVMRGHGRRRREGDRRRARAWATTRSTARSPAATSSTPVNGDEGARSGSPTTS